MYSYCCQACLNVPHMISKKLKCYTCILKEAEMLAKFTAHMITKGEVLRTFFRL